MADTPKSLLKRIDKLSEEEFQCLMSMIRAKKSKNNPTGNKEEGLQLEEKQPCVHCGSINTKKHGKISGRQRFICKYCGKTFNTATGAITSSSRLTTAQWKELIRGIIEKLPIKEIQRM